MNLKEICKDANDLATEVGNFIKSEVRNIRNADIKEKGLHDYVTYVDKTSEEKLITGLKEVIPEAGFIAEENPLLTTSDNYNWIIDPLDGTTNFIHAIPVFAISIALMHRNEIILGIVYEINSKELFYSWKDGGVYLNSNAIRVSSSKKLDDSLIATGFPFHDFSRLDPYLNILTYFINNTRGLRRLGSAAVDLAYVACGRFDGFFEYGLKPWDVAAGSFLVQQAGGKVTDFKGKENFIFNNEILAANITIYNEMFEHIKKYFC